MSAFATENWSDYALARGKSGTRVFIVTGASSSDEAITAIGIKEGDKHPEDARTFVQAGGIAADKSKGPAVHRVTVTYGTLQIGQLTNSPLDDPPLWLPDQQEQSEDVDIDVNGNPIANSAGEPFATPVKRNFSTLLITMTRNESSFNIQRALSFRNKLNDATVVLPGIGSLLKKQLLCKSIRVAQGYATTAEYVKVIYLFEARPYRTIDGGPQDVTGFTKRLLDQGRKALYRPPGIGSGGILGPMKWKGKGSSKGQNVTTDVSLNGTGAPIDTDSFDVGDFGATLGSRDLPDGVIAEKPGDCVWLHYEVYETISFNGLNFR